MGDNIIRIAMWSGPRNISTAMMRSWENRRDTAVIDEPFYACYLSKTGIVHPMQEEVLASQSSDWGTVIEQDLRGSLAEGQTIQYQKHMTQHMVGELDEDWFASLRHCFLIRHPAEVVASYGQKRGEVCAEDVGFARQRELFELARSLGFDTPVIDSKKVLSDPEGSLTAVCNALDVSFDPAMLAWPAGTRDSDGAWAPHWYQNVEKSTGFAPYIKRRLFLSKEQQSVVDECLDDYLALAEHQL